MLFASAIAQVCPGMDLTHTDRGERTQICFKEHAAGVGGEVTEEDGGGGVNIQITMTGTACLL